MVKKVQESKAAKLAKARRKSTEKKKWTTGKVKEASKFKVFVDEELIEKIKTDVQKMDVITKNRIAQKYVVEVNLANDILKYLEEQKLIEATFKSSKLKIYTKAAVKTE